MNEPAKTPPAKREEARVQVETDDHGALVPHTLDEMWRIATAFFNSNAKPRGLDKIEDVFLVLQAGAEAGLKPVASMRCIHIVNGVPSWSGAGALAKIQQSGEAKVFMMGHAGEGDDYHAWIKVQRHDMDAPTTVKYSVADAKTAGLWGKKTRTGQPTPWITAPDDMLLWRCVSRVAKRYFPGPLLGFEVAEVARDYRHELTEPATTTAELPPPAEPDPLLDAAPADPVVDAEFTNESEKQQEPPTEEEPPPPTEEPQPGVVCDVCSDPDEQVMHATSEDCPKRKKPAETKTGRKRRKPLKSQRCEAEGCDKPAESFYGSGMRAACSDECAERAGFGAQQ